MPAKPPRLNGNAARLTRPVELILRAIGGPAAVGGADVGGGGSSGGIDSGGGLGGSRG
jgi:hypothetical protein